MEKRMKELEDSLTITMDNRIKEMIAQYIMSDAQHLNDLWILITERQYPICSRAAWVLDYICTNDKHLLETWTEQIAAYFPKITNNSVRRIMAKLLSQTTIPEVYESNVLNAAFDWLSDPAIPVAVRVNCMQIIYNLYRKYPEIAPELIAIIQNELTEGSAGFKNRGIKILKKLKKEM